MYKTPVKLVNSTLKKLCIYKNKIIEYYNRIKYSFYNLYLLITKNQNSKMSIKEE